MKELAAPQSAMTTNSPDFTNGPFPLPADAVTPRSPNLSNVSSCLHRVLLLSSLALGVATSCSHQPPQRPNVLLILVDSLRADRVGFAGYQDRPTSPTLDSLARAGVAFTNCIAQAPYTRASVPSLLTSRYPRDAAHTTQGVDTEDGEQLPTTELPEDAETLAQVLKREGYTCGGFVANELVQLRIDDLERGFDHYHDGVLCASGDCAGRLTAAALSWLRSSAREPWLCYVHYMDVHLPYLPPSEYRESFAPGNPDSLRAHVWWIRRAAEAESASAHTRREFVGAMYDAEIAYVDDEIGRLLGSVRESGLHRTVMVVVASDHGDELFERGWYGHGHTLYHELVRCPLILSWEGRLPEGVQIGSVVRNVDIVPTVLDLIGRPPDTGMVGMSLRPLWKGEVDKRTAFIEGCGEGITRGDWKLWRTGKECRLYNLAEDPSELHDLSDTFPEAVQRLGKLLASWERTTPLAHKRTEARVEAQIDSAAVERLRALGYLQ